MWIRYDCECLWVWIRVVSIGYTCDLHVLFVISVMNNIIIDCCCNRCCYCCCYYCYCASLLSVLTIMILTMMTMNNDYDIHNVWLQFTIYTSLSGDNFKWNVSTLLSGFCVHLYRSVYSSCILKIHLLAHSEPYSYKKIHSTEWIFSRFELKKVAANLLIGK